MVTKIIVSNTLYNIDVYINGVKIEKEFSNENYHYYSFENDSEKEFFLRVEQNGLRINKFFKPYQFVCFGFRMGLLFFWPVKFYCQYCAYIKNGAEIILDIVRDNRPVKSFKESGEYVFFNNSKGKNINRVKYEKKTQLIPKRSKFSWYLLNVLCSVLSSSLIVILIIFLIFGAATNIDFELDRLFSTWDEIIFGYGLIAFQLVYMIYIIVRHTILLFNNDGTYYEKE